MRWPDHGQNCIGDGGIGPKMGLLFFSKRYYRMYSVITTSGPNMDEKKCIKCGTGLIPCSIVEYSSSTGKGHSAGPLFLETVDSIDHFYQISGKDIIKPKIKEGMKERSNDLESSFFAEYCKRKLLFKMRPYICPDCGFIEFFTTESLESTLKTADGSIRKELNSHYH